jgi:hypothetical protein
MKAVTTLSLRFSYGLQANDNVVAANGFLNDAPAWGGHAGIVLSSSPNCVVTRNLLIGNREGFNFREQSRTTPRIDHPKDAEVSIWNHDDIIKNNVMAYNRDAQTRGWFATGDRRHWPGKIQREQERKDRADPGNAKLRYQPVQKISLEDLHIEMSRNIYATNPRQPLFIWGTSWMPHAQYDSIDAVVRALNLEKGSRVGPVQFRDYMHGDFRVPGNSMIRQMQCYPQREVPGVSLGTN